MKHSSKTSLFREIAAVMADDELEYEELSHLYNRVAVSKEIDAALEFWIET